MKVLVFLLVSAICIEQSNDVAWARLPSSWEKSLKSPRSNRLNKRRDELRKTVEELKNNAIEREKTLEKLELKKSELHRELKELKKR